MWRPNSPGDAFLVAVPFIENDAKIVRINVSMESGMVKAIDAAASARNLTRSAFLAQAAPARDRALTSPPHNTADDFASALLAMVRGETRPRKTRIPACQKT